MNFLAHLYLAEDSTASVVGNLLGDFCKGNLDDRWPPEVNDGIRMHRAVDAFTDSHPEFKRCRDLFSPSYRRFGGIIVDILWDHVLARDWAAYSDEPLEDFAQRMYTHLREAPWSLPERMVHLVEMMQRMDLLTSYREWDQIEEALFRVGSRLKRGEFMRAAAVEFPAVEEEFVQGFRAYFPQLIAFRDEFAQQG